MVEVAWGLGCDLHVNVLLLELLVLQVQLGCLRERGVASILLLSSQRLLLSKRLENR